MVFQTIIHRKKNKKTRIALRDIFGIGPHSANLLCDIVGISNQKVHELGSQQIDRISSVLTNSFFFGSELKKLIKSDIQRLQDIKAFRSRQTIKLTKKWKK